MRVCVSGMTKISLFEGRAVGDSYAFCAANKRFVPIEEKKKAKKKKKITKEREQVVNPQDERRGGMERRPFTGDGAGVCNFNNKFRIKRYIYFVSCSSNLFLATAFHS